MAMKRHLSIPTPTTGRPARDLDALHVGLRHDEEGKAPCACPVSRIGKGRGIGSGDGIAHARDIGLEQGRHVVIRVVAVEVPPRVEPVRTSTPQAKHGVHGQETVEPVGHVRRNGEAKQTAPILHHKRDVPQVQRLDQRDKALPVEVECVGGILHRLVGPTEAEQVGRDHARAGFKEDGIMCR
jgi:hypothetical protein